MRWLVLLAVLCACPPSPPVNPPRPDASDAASPPPANCGAACTNERGLGCPGASGCPTACARLMRNHPEYVVCVQAARSCDAINACDTAAAGSGTPSGPGSGRSGP